MLAILTFLLLESVRVSNCPQRPPMRFPLASCLSLLSARIKASWAGPREAVPTFSALRPHLSNASEDQLPGQGAPHAPPAFYHLGAAYYSLGLKVAVTSCLPETQRHRWLWCLIPAFFSSPRCSPKPQPGGLLWLSSGWESACQFRGHRVHPRSGKIPHTAAQLNLCPATRGQPSVAAAGESPCLAIDPAQHSYPTPLKKSNLGGPLLASAVYILKSCLVFLYVVWLLSCHWLSVTPRTVAPPGYSSWDSPGKNTGVGCQALLQGIFPTQGLNSCVLHWLADTLPLSHLGRTMEVSLYCWFVLFSRSVVSDSLWLHGLQHPRPPCPSPTPGVHLNPRPLSRWCHPAISSSVVPFSSCPQFLPASGSFPMSQLFESDGQCIRALASTSVLPMNIQGWFLLGWTGRISLQSKGLSTLFSNTTVWKHQFFGIEPSLWSNSHIYIWLLEKT